MLLVKKDKTHIPLFSLIFSVKKDGEGATKPIRNIGL